MMQQVETGGFTLTELAHRFNLSVPRVHQLVQRYANPVDLKVQLPMRVLDQLTAEAERRGTKAHALARAILTIVASDNLFNAVIGEHEVEDA